MERKLILNKELLYKTSKQQILALLESKKIQAAFFDLDGVIIDAEPMHFQAWKEFFNKIGFIDLTIELYNQFLKSRALSPALINLFKIHESEYPQFKKFADLEGYIDPEGQKEEFFSRPEAEQKIRWELIEFRTIRENLYIETVTKNPPDLIPGADKFLSLLKNHYSVKTGIVTSGVKLIKENLARHNLLTCFDLILSSADTNRLSPYLNKFIKGKPSSDLWQESCYRLNVDPAKCIGFEDSYKNILGIKQAGLSAYGVDAGENNFKYADGVIDNFLDIP